MIKSIPLKTYVASALLCLTLFASCSADDDPALPEGKYPMTFATAMEGLTQTRATTDDTWKGDEEIAVQVGSEVKQYTPTTSGKTATLTGANDANTFYWQRADETKTVSAWYCGDGSTAAGQANAAQLPNTWAVKADQSGDGYAKSDLLYAKPLEMAYSNRDNSPLSFKHLTAKVVINLTYSKGLNAEQIKNATVSIVSQPTTSGTIEAKDGTVAPITTPGNGTIIPNNVSGTPPTGFQKSVQAIVVPQKVTTGTKFIKVTIGEGSAAERDYYYAPEKNADIITIECGNQYTYNITVTKEELVVTPQTVTWEESTASAGEEVKTFVVTVPKADGVTNFDVSDATLLSEGKYAVKTHTTTITISYKTNLNRRYKLIKGIARVSTSTDANGTITLTVSDIRGDLVFYFTIF